MNFITAFLDNSNQIGAGLLAAHALAIAIVNITPTPKDNAVLRKVYPIVEAFAGILTRRAKQ
jgi:hypothetical protein